MINDSNKPRPMYGEARFNRSSHELWADFEPHTIGQDYKGRTFSVLDNLTQLKFTDCDFTGAKMPPNAEGAQFFKCMMKDVDFSFTNFSHALFERVDFSGSTLGLLGGARLHHATFKDCIFHGVNLNDPKFKDTKFEGSIEGLILPKEHLQHVDLTKADTTGLMISNDQGVVRTYEAVMKEASLAEDAAKIAHTGENVLKQVKGNKTLLVTGAVVAAGAVGVALYRSVTNKKQKKIWVAEVDTQQEQSTKVAQR